MITKGFTLGCRATDKASDLPRKRLNGLCLHWIMNAVECLDACVRVYGSCGLCYDYGDSVYGSFSVNLM